MSRALLALVLALAGCDAPELLGRDALLDPASCQTCHPNHFREWSGSMHAYASEDPVFLAMNARGQRETKGALGDFCVSCHAPVAVRTGATRDGLNLASLPRSVKGVTCYFCHQIDKVEGTHNAAVRFADDGVLRGGILDPVGNGAHRAEYSPLHDREELGSSPTCGSCHDIVTPAGVHLERTFAEWQGTVFAQGNPKSLLSCAKCHMPGRDGLAAEAPGVYLRLVHDHSMPGVDVALTPFPEMEAQRAAVQRDLDPAISAKLCVGADQIQVTLDNIFVGHGWPSGAMQDRRAWVELIAYRAGEVIFETGNVKEGEAVSKLADPAPWVLRDRILDEAGKEVHMFWDARSYESVQLPPSVTNDPRDARFFHAVTRTFYNVFAADRVTLRVRLRPMDFDVLDDLIASGDLEPTVRDRLSTFTLASTVIEWNKSEAVSCKP